MPSNCLLDPTVPSDRLLGNTTGESILQKSQGRLTSGVARQTVTGQTHLWCCPVDSHRALTSGVAQQTVTGQTHLWCHPADISRADLLLVSLKDSHKADLPLVSPGSHRVDSPLVFPSRQSQGRHTSGVV